MADSQGRSDVPTVDRSPDLTNSRRCRLTRWTFSSESTWSLRRSRRWSGRRPASPGAGSHSVPACLADEYFSQRRPRRPHLPPRQAQRHPALRLALHVPRQRDTRRCVPASTSSLLLTVVLQACASCVPRRVATVGLSLLVLRRRGALHHRSLPPETIDLLWTRSGRPEKSWSSPSRFRDREDAPVGLPRCQSEQTSRQPCHVDDSPDLRGMPSSRLSSSSSLVRLR